MNLSRREYEGIARAAKQKGAEIFPPYYRVRLAKEKCAPDGIVATSSFASVSWQNLSDHTIKRIIEIPENDKTFQNYVEKSFNREFILYASYGGDGSGRQVNFQQEHEKKIRDSSLFVTFYIPIRIVSADTKELLWQNPSPHSHRMCRVKKMEFKKEDRNFVLNELKENEKEIAELENTVVSLKSGKFTRGRS